MNREDIVLDPEELAEGWIIFPNRYFTLRVNGRP
jgi:hypothetical protein